MRPTADAQPKGQNRKFEQWISKSARATFTTARRISDSARNLIRRFQPCRVVSAERPPVFCSRRSRLSRGRSRMPGTSCSRRLGRLGTASYESPSRVVGQHVQSANTRPMYSPTRLQWQGKLIARDLGAGQLDRDKRPVCLCTTLSHKVIETADSKRSLSAAAALSAALGRSVGG